jgi:hypothetical protein
MRARRRQLILSWKSGLGLMRDGLKLYFAGEFSKRAIGYYEG